MKDFGSFPFSAIFFEILLVWAKLVSILLQMFGPGILCCWDITILLKQILLCYLLPQNSLKFFHVFRINTKTLSWSKIHLMFWPLYTFYTSLCTISLPSHPTRLASYHKPSLTTGLLLYFIYLFGTLLYMINRHP